ncbi:MAG: hypothetical protein SNG18_01265 [Rikenellaceae bacterium]
MKSKLKILDITHHTLLFGMVLCGLFIWLYLGQSVGELKPLEGGSVVAQIVHQWQLSHPIMGVVVTMLLLFYSALSSAIVTSRFRLYDHPSCLPMELYMVLSMGVMASDTPLLTAVVMAFIIRAQGALFSSYRSANSSRQLFEGAVLIGALPLLYSPLTVMWIVVLAALSLFERSLREAIVVVVGLTIIPLANMYIVWLVGGDFVAPIGDFVDLITTPSSFKLASLYQSIPRVIFLVVFIYTCVSGMLLSSLLDNTPKARRRITMVTMVFILLCVTILLPSVTSMTIALIGVPAALLAPIALIKLPRLLSAILYVVILLLGLFNILVEF